MKRWIHIYTHTHRDVDMDIDTDIDTHFFFPLPYAGMLFQISLHDTSHLNLSTFRNQYQCGFLNYPHVNWFLSSNNSLSHHFIWFLCCLTQSVCIYLIVYFLTSPAPLPRGRCAPWWEGLFTLLITVTGNSGLHMVASFKNISWIGI